MARGSVEFTGLNEKNKQAKLSTSVYLDRLYRELTYPNTPPTMTAKIAQHVLKGAQPKKYRGGIGKKIQLSTTRIFNDFLEQRKGSTK